MKMKTNPGGLIAPKNVIGRDSFIDQLWQALEQQSVIILAERRIGKSSILRKITKEKPQKWLPILWDVEGIDSLPRFVQGLRSELEPYLNKTEQGKQWLTKIHHFLAGAKLLGVEMPQIKQIDWHDVLISLLKTLGDYQQQHQQVLLIWDEFPWMLQKIIKNEGHKAAGDLLDSLRHCRQSNTSLRMIFTGSIGLHQVIHTIRAQGYSNEPVNDMQVISLDALANNDACQLAQALISGEGIAQKMANQDIGELCSLVDNVPYYIHHLIRGLCNSEDSAQRIVQAAIAGTDNSWQLEHYYTRLADYYPQQWPKYAIVLDMLAYSDTSLRRKQIQQSLKSDPQASNDETLQNNETLKQILRHLVEDHYLVQDIDTAAYQFRYPLIKKWWCFYRD
jgi:hypothetical protein